MLVWSAGLSGALGTVSFESYSYPGYFMRHLGSDLFLESEYNPRNPGDCSLSDVQRHF